MATPKIIDIVSNEERFKKLTKKIRINDQFIYFDYSKTHVSSDFLEEKFKEFNSSIMQKENMFARLNINYPENKPVLNFLCRSGAFIAKLRGIEYEIREEKDEIIYNTLVEMREFCRLFHEGKILGATGKPLKTIVNIGIGGSDLGPRMVTAALEYYKMGSDVYFISNVDPTETDQVFSKIKVEETLFIVVSKTFTTEETRTNAQIAFKRVCETLSVDENLAKKHFVAATANIEEAKTFGIDKCFSVIDEVNGRFSLWSACGLSIALYIGFDNFLDLLDGASKMDYHFSSVVFHDNIPVIHAVIENYYNNEQNGEGYDNICILPYDAYLKLFPAYLQQAEMESNGKVATEEGKTTKKTGMIVWGGIGTDCQHSFFQLIHQGTRNILCEFLLPLSTLSSCQQNHKILLSNCLAQSRALMLGKPSFDLNQHFDGNKPSITIAYSKLTPSVLGALISLYENKIITQGFMWGINSFDQFGVTLGKNIAKEISKNIDNLDCFDLSTREILKLYGELKKNNE
ncbi:putative glucose-6-phosphate isomerase [Dictyocoela muelleri]|nr:putative glucose-6-phosphate isomerase [Dictyocoela muelleri]